MPVLPASTDPFVFLSGLERLGMKFGLENMTRLCTALGHPEQRFRSILVAGTNGKGSVTAMVERALCTAGHRSARYTSPHLERLEERFAIRGEETDTPALAAALTRVRRAIEMLLRDGVLASPPTYFECATAAAFELFASAGVDVAVLEVGLGGRLDATNVVMPIAAAITSIDFDHQALLGDTLASIAREKAGIVKPGIPVVCGPVPAEALAVIEEVCRERGAELVRSDREVRESARVTGAGTRADFSTRAHVFTDVTLALPGRHQVDNAALAIRLLEELETLGVPVGAEAIRSGLEHTAWPGRLERARCRGAEVILDAAHNPAGARALASFLAEAGWSGATLVFGALQDKDVAGMLKALGPVCSRIICTTPDSPRALAADRAAGIAAAQEIVPVLEIVPDPGAALARACASSARVVVAGSIFLIGPLRGILR